MPDGPSKTALKQKALNLLRRKKLYETQRNSVQSRSYNVESTGMMIESMRDTKLMYSSMVAAKRQMAVGMKGLDVENFERVLEDLSEFREMQTEVEQSLNEFSMADVDETALNDELDQLQYEDYVLGEPTSLAASEPPVASTTGASYAAPNFHTEAGNGIKGSDRDDILRLL